MSAAANPGGVANARLVDDISEQTADELIMLDDRSV